MPVVVLLLKGEDVGNAESKSHKPRKSGTEPAGKPRRAKGSGEPSDVAAGATAPTPTPDVSRALDLAVVLQTEKSKDVALALPPVLDPNVKPTWYRPADSKARKKFEKIAVHREAGRSDAEIAKLMKTTEQNIRQTVYIAKKNGWMDDDGEPVDIEAQLALEVDRKIVRNIDATLDGTMSNWQQHEMTIAAAKGRGIFKNHEKSEGGGMLQLPVVAIRIEMPPLGAAQQIINEVNVGGTPAYIEGEVADGTEPESQPALVPSASRAVQQDGHVPVV